MKPHRTDLISLAFGVVFLAAASVWLTDLLVGLEVITVGWFVAGSLLLLGAAGLTSALTSNHRRSRD